MEKMDNDAKMIKTVAPGRTFGLSYKSDILESDVLEII